jgi:hypothetical protein
MFHSYHFHILDNEAREHKSVVQGVYLAAQRLSLGVHTVAVGAVVVVVLE